MKTAALGVSRAISTSDLRQLADNGKCPSCHHETDDADCHNAQCHLSADYDDEFEAMQEQADVMIARTRGRYMRGARQQPR